MLADLLRKFRGTRRAGVRDVAPGATHPHRVAASLLPARRSECRSASDRRFEADQLLRRRGQAKDVGSTAKLGRRDGRRSLILAPCPFMEADMSRLCLASFPPIPVTVVLALALGGCVEPPPAYSSYAAPQASNAGAPPAMPECREMHLTVMIGNQPQDAVGTACRQPDGTWRIRG
jgi:hypothetical protein